MYKYPLDLDTSNELFAHLLNHDKYQRQQITDLINIVQNALEETQDEDSMWQADAETFLKHYSKLKVDRENLKFNVENALKARGLDTPSKIHPSTAPTYSGSIGAGMINLNDPHIASQLNESEDRLGPPMTEGEVASYFNEKPKRKGKKSKQKDFKKMTLEEIEEWERKQDNATDLYKISARVKNLARADGAALTPVGEMLANTYVHVLKSLYDFADTIADKETKIKLISLIRSNEGMPANLISAAKANVVEGK